MSDLYTIGYKGKPLAVFIGQLRVAHVDAVIDIRLRNTSHLAGYTKRDDLAFLLREGFGIAYQHLPELAPTPEIREAYLSTGDWDAYVAHFLPLLDTRDALSHGRTVFQKYGAPCLLCSEPTADRCHRRLVAEYWAARLPGVRVFHL
ncbi:MAG: DUF488 domain-containing protein [Anaerolineae bacterium]|nr:DUF488 domain-containing protein [Anaerolineae bacterium]